ncbi:MAG: flippase-like domain-containing protein [Deltaproteobacteria bacterium]|nr:flippase-like domain-containing protein [Deltaproteobacteria bacterium]
MLILYYLFRQYPPSQILTAWQYLNVLPFCIYSIGYFIFMWFFDCWSLGWFFSHFGHPLSVRDIGPIRFASYLLMTLNFGAGQGAFAYFLKQKKKIPFFKSSSLMLFIVLIDLYTTILLAFIGSLTTNLVVHEINLSQFIQAIWGGSTVGLFALFLFFRLPLNWRTLKWVRTRDLFHTFHHAVPTDYLRGIMARLPMHLALNTTLYVVAHFFQASIPLTKVLAFFPFVVLVGTIPITPSGLGTTQAAMVEFFKPHIQGVPLENGLLSVGELLFYIGLLFSVFNLLLKLVTGLYFLKKQDADLPIS